ncbi:hypothetical protein BDR07DRAFT_126166 [Suillus spraguei]|nr:hypothetical protein BDR07DRAFT_126166 [Suillus spraguei]
MFCSELVRDLVSHFPSFSGDVDGATAMFRPQFIRGLHPLVQGAVSLFLSMIWALMVVFSLCMRGSTYSFISQGSYVMPATHRVLFSDSSRFLNINTRLFTPQSDNLCQQTYLYTMVCPFCCEVPPPAHLPKSHL